MVKTFKSKSYFLFRQFSYLAEQTTIRIHCVWPNTKCVSFMVSPLRWGNFMIMKILFASKLRLNKSYSDVMFVNVSITFWCHFDGVTGNVSMSDFIQDYYMHVIRLSPTKLYNENNTYVDWRLGGHGRFHGKEHESIPIFGCVNNNIALYYDSYTAKSVANGNRWLCVLYCSSIHHVNVKLISL